MTTREKHILARAVGIQKENWGNHAFSEIIELLKFGKEIPAIHCSVFKRFSRIMVA